MTKMLLVLALWSGPAVAQESGESKLARGLLRLLAKTPEGPIVIFTADEGHSCRAVIDQVGLWAARDQRVHPIDGTPDAEDFLVDTLKSSSRFGEFALGKGLALIYRLTDANLESRVSLKLADRILNGGDRDGWAFNPITAPGILFEVRETAPFVHRDIVRSVFPVAREAASFEGCRYYLFSREALISSDSSACDRRLEPAVKSGWYRDENIVDP